MKKIILSFVLVLFCFVSVGQKQPVDYVNPFIGTTNFGTTNPGAVVPHGMMSVVPFNVMGSDSLNVWDKDKRWWSTPYEYNNKFFTGFSHVNLSGVGCPDLGSLLLMPTTGELKVDYKQYGTLFEAEVASPGYYSNFLVDYDIKTEVSAAERSSIARFTFPGGDSHILLNLGEGLTNESGAWMRMVGDYEVEGSKLLGTFCYNAQAVFPIYFVMRLTKKPLKAGYWKMQPPKTGVEAQWDKDSGKYKLYTKYARDIAGDDIGAWFSFNTQPGETIGVQIGVSFVSVENARLNLDAEQPVYDFEKVRTEARNSWNETLSKIKVEGGTEDQKEVFYTALYHTQIHPNVLNDVNGQYPALESGEIMTTEGTRYTVFSLWDTYRNLHQLMTLVYPDRQEQMINSMLDMYREHGWLPKWELYGRETLTMEGDPSIPVIVDSYLKGLRNFDAELAYEAMYKSATLPGVSHDNDDIAKHGHMPDSYFASEAEKSGQTFNLLRPDNTDYMRLGYVPLRSQYDNSVSHALEYYIADYALSRFADALGKKEDAEMFRKRSLGYKHYYSKEYGTFRPILPDGKFLTPFNPRQGENFEEVPGFHEGSAWNYTFYVPHDVYGLAKLMGGKKQFVDKLQMVFDDGLYDPANEPDIAYPYLFSYFKGEEWRTQKTVRELLAKYYTTNPDGIPGNDDTGTMSAWAVFSMMGFYPDCPADPSYTLTSPVFDKITIELDKRYYPSGQLVIKGKNNSPENIYIKNITVGKKKFAEFRITHKQLVESENIVFDFRK